MAQRSTLEAERPQKSQKANKRSANGGTAESKASLRSDRDRVFEAFRRWVYLEASLDPLGFLEPLKSPDLDGLEGADADQARRIYAGSIGADFMHLLEAERRDWIAARMEGPAPETD